ncbi:MAG: hypothetical protein V3V08_16410 [Nannocystaceae bacterium]
MRFAEMLRIPRADEPVAHWHISPRVDTLAYAFSWLWVLIPLGLMGDEKLDYIVVYLFILAATDVHRHYNFPLVYMDREVRKKFPARFWLFPGVMLVLFITSPWLTSQKYYLSTVDVSALLAYVVVLIQICHRDGSRIALASRTYTIGLIVPAAAAAAAAAVTTLGAPAWGLAPGWCWLVAALFTTTYFDLHVRRLRLAGHGPDGLRTFGYPRVVLALMIFVLAFGVDLDSRLHAGGFPIQAVFNTLAVFAGAWNIWHIYMQKYGIMRLYAAKSGRADALAGWLDRLMIFCWLPLYFAWLGPAYRELVAKYFRRGNHILPDIIRFFDSIQHIAVPAAAGFIVVSVALWLRKEHAATGLRNKPRLVMALGTTCLAASFMFMDPVKVYLAYAFTHGIEYMVFVWAWQRKRYQQELSHKPRLGRLLQRPLLAYATFTLSLAAIFLYLKYYGRYIHAAADPPRAFGFRTASLVLYWSVYQSMVHFYWDGFMWKMRLKSVRAHI